MTLPRILLAVSLLLPTVGCTPKDDSEAKPTEQAMREGLDKIIVAPRSPPKVTVVEAGQEPRLPMRLHPAAGLREALELSVGLRMTMNNGVQDLPSVPVPTTKTRLSVEVEEARSGGFSVRQSVDAVDVISVPETPKTVVDQVKAATEPLAQYRAVMRMDPRGAVLGGEVMLPRDVPVMVRQTMQQMTESLGQLAVPLPAEPVGVGAKWTAVHDIEQSGMKLRQTAHYTMVSRDGDKASLELTIDQQLVDPNVDVPGMLGASARVGRFESSGRGTLELDLSHVTPTAMHMTIDLSLSMDVSMLGQDQHLEMDMGIDLSMTRTPDGG